MSCNYIFVNLKHITVPLGTPRRWKNSIYLKGICRKSRRIQVLSTTIDSQDFWGVCFIGKEYYSQNSDLFQCKMFFSWKCFLFLFLAAFLKILQKCIFKSLHIFLSVWYDVKWKYLLILQTDSNTPHTTH